MWDSLLEDKNCSLIPLLHSSPQVHSLLVYGKYCISQSQNNSLSPLNVTFFDSLRQVLKRRPVLHDRQEKTTSSSPDFKFLEVPGCSHNLPHLFLIGTLSPHSLQFTKEAQRTTAFCYSCTNITHTTPFVL